MVTVFRNCQLLKNHLLLNEDLWVENGVIIDPQKLFYSGRTFDKEVNCQGAIVSPGFIDLQINGGFGVDFTFDITDAETAKDCLTKVSKGLVQHGTVFTDSNHRRLYCI